MHLSDGDVLQFYVLSVLTACCCHIAAATLLVHIWLVHGTQ